MVTGTMPAVKGRFTENGNQNDRTCGARGARLPRTAKALLESLP